MTEVWFKFPNNKAEELACWDTYEQALRYLCASLVPLLEDRVKTLEAGQVFIDKEYYFNKRGHVRKAIMKNEDDLRDLVEVLWKNDDEAPKWTISLVVV